MQWIYPQCWNWFICLYLPYCVLFCISSHFHAVQLHIDVYAPQKTECIVQSACVQAEKLSPAARTGNLNHLMHEIIYVPGQVKYCDGCLCMRKKRHWRIVGIWVCAKRPWREKESARHVDIDRYIYEWESVCLYGCAIFIARAAQRHKIRWRVDNAILLSIQSARGSLFNTAEEKARERSLFGIYYHRCLIYCCVLLHKNAVICRAGAKIARLTKPCI